MYKYTLSKRCRLSRVHSYLDRVDCDFSNKLFYVFYLGRYNNTPMYTYGETLDIHLLELSLNKRFPTYKKELLIPVNDLVFAKRTVDIFLDVQKLKTEFPLKTSVEFEEYEFFTTSESQDISKITEEITDIFRIETREQSLM